MLQVLLATGNPHKTREFAEILGPEVEVCDLTAEVELPRVEETGLTFEANAILKAIAASQRSLALVVGDDSGLEVDVLGGAPGIRSARYAGEKATDKDNIEKLLSELGRCSQPFPHSARFRCCLALAKQGRIVMTFEGLIEGRIIPAPRGQSGFGYDPVFQPHGFEQTFAELRPADKNRISHRGRAIQLLRDTLLVGSS